jgi:hypothetical protein
VASGSVVDTYHPSWSYENGSENPSTYGYIIKHVIEDVMLDLVDPQVTPNAAYAGWLHANALSFLEGGYYGTTQAEVSRESLGHLHGASFGIVQAGGQLDAAWSWAVPMAGRILRIHVANVPTKTATYENLDPWGEPRPRLREPPSLTPPSA